MEGEEGFDVKKQIRDVHFGSDMEASVIQRIGSGMPVTVQVVADHLEKSYDFSPP